MTTPTPRWTADERTVIDRIARHIWPSGGNGQVPTDAPEEIFEDLKRAGVLIPVGGETRQEWCARTLGLQYPYLDESSVWLKYGELRSRGYTAEVVTRTVTTWSEGTTLTGPWREVTDDPA